MSNRIINGVIPPRTVYRFAPITSVRHASLASAISRGIRKADDSSSRLGRVTHIKNEERGDPNGGPPGRLSRLQAERRRSVEMKTGQERRHAQRGYNRSDDISHEAPQGKPYTTAGSEFLYGTFSVRAALEARRRLLHKLYIWRGPSDTGDEVDHSIISLARTKRVPVQLVTGTWDKMLLKLSNQRPHNGVVLEASPIPKLPATSLDSLATTGDELRVRRATQSLEDENINRIFDTSGGRTVISRSGDRARYPLLLWLDRITDTGNLGAIIRTAYFMGVDAVVIPEHGTAPFTPITVKASAGAAELLPIMIVKHELEFIRLSQENGWKFIAAVAPDSTSTWKKLSQQGSFVADVALDSFPCVLMVGNEGEGLRLNMQKAADNFVSIRGARGPADGVESLNVSVAAALLVARMLSRSPASRGGGPAPSISKEASPSNERDSPLF